MEGRQTRIQLCGRLKVRVEGRDVEDALPGRQGRVLLAFLVLERRRESTRPELEEALWGECLPSAPNIALSALLSKLRRALGADAIEGKHAVRLVLSADASVDVEAAIEALHAAETAVLERDWARVYAKGHVALYTFARPFLPDCDGPWLEETRRHFAELHVRALEAAAASSLGIAGSELPIAEQQARALIELEPYRESGYRLLLETLAARGNVADALRVHERLRTLLRDELGIVPGPEVRAVHERLLRAQDQPAGGAPIPLILPPLRGTAALVGRAGELDRLRRAAADVRQGTRRTVLIAGEGGIGKTRLAHELLAAEHRAGATVLSGRAPERPLAAFQPFVEAIRHYARHEPPASLRSQLDQAGPGIGLLVPELSAGSPDGVDRLRMFDAVDRLLVEIAREHSPLMLLVDDLHWADEPTLLLFAHLASASVDAPLLILATYRPTDVAPDHPFSEIAAGLRASGMAEEVILGGLAAEQIAELIESVGGHTPPPALNEAVRRRTAGNPLFVEEVVTDLFESGAVAVDGDGSWRWNLDREEVRIPDRVGATITRRLLRLPAATRDLLTTAAAIGDVVDLDMLGETVEAPLEHILGWVDEVCRAGLLVAHPAGRSVGFTHPLVREALAVGTDPVRATLLHAHIAGVLESRGASAWEVVTHLLAAGDRAPADRVVPLALAAADERTAQLAYEDAIAVIDDAYEMVDASELELRRRLMSRRALAHSALWHVVAEGFRPRVVLGG